MCSSCETFRESLRRQISETQNPKSKRFMSKLSKDMSHERKKGWKIKSHVDLVYWFPWLYSSRYLYVWLVAQVKDFSKEKADIPANIYLKINIC